VRRRRSRSVRRGNSGWEGSVGSKGRQRAESTLSISADAISGVLSFLMMEAAEGE
jgi:hypothetical protein